ncbi:Pimeloyl-ACP methyl ester carboxylesterase [Gordonia malaquae]|uniref:Putative hydrolase n=1 Tax=Gordonia malaquae NBRC 108250 TaxID=1223542 RepID=M3UWR7_GORML|nr:alpha/beta fold hydrolase [Gordonia malaquae]GAC80102.1 putative hydrolase [Gordonia malaquae NBRC 108250]SEC37892.1 Pimeloyl-ACP methyl ester carboxylesterase [Gordonia malaquae]
MTMLHVDGIDLAADRRGPAEAPTVLLIAGGGQSMDWWTPEFCDALSAGSLQVIRYDHRDTGRSSQSPPGRRPDYTGDDLVTDALRVLNAFDVERAHLVGMSMGGGIAQTLAVRHPDRVASATLVESSPAGGDHGSLPGPTAAVAATWTEPAPDIDWADVNSVIDYRVDVERPYACPDRFDEARVRRIASLEVRRTANVESSMSNHFVAAPSGGVDPAMIAAPTLVVHSVDDPMYPVEHGRALAAMIPGSRFLELAGVGHEIPPPQSWDVVLPAIRQLVSATP